jgi:acetyl esterase/lipase
VSRRHLAPGLVLVLIIVVTFAAVALVRPGTEADPATATTEADPLDPSWSNLSPAEIATLPASGCATVTYTPPAASAAHDADLCRPDETTGRAVILIHGGGGYSGDRAGLAPWTRWYLRQGFVTLAIDYTLVGDGTSAPVYPAPERDVKAAVQYLRRVSDEVGVDPEAIIVHGSSAGARLGAQAHVTSGEPWFESADLWPDVPDHTNGLVAFYGYYDGTTLVAEEYLGGPLNSQDPAVQQRITQADSTTHAGGATGPVLLFHGDVDGLVAVGQTEHFGQALAESGTDVTTRILVDENHAFDQRPGDPFTDIGRVAAGEILGWLDRALPAR